MNRCFVIQPFDGAGFDNRYDDVISPAISDAGLEPYRVDRDLESIIPIEDIEQQIELAEICIADISNDKPNVWFEVGYAIAAKKSIVLICKRGRPKFPFDVQHRGIIEYETDAPRDFDKLKTSITNKITALLNREKRSPQVAALSSISSVEGLEAIEIAALVTIAEELHEQDGGVTSYHIQSGMEQAGYRKIAASLGVRGLMRKGLVQELSTHDHNGNSFTVYRETDVGSEWLASNTEKIKLTKDPQSKESGFDDDIPF